MRWLMNGPVLSDDPVHYQVSCPASHTIPDHWEFLDYAPAGIQTGCIRAHAEGGPPESKITFITGFKPDILMYNNPQIRALQRSGVEVDILPLPDPGNQIGYLQDNKKIVRKLLGESPPPGGIKEGIPNYIFAHSLGGRATLANMLDEDFADHINRNYAGGIFIAPHTTSPYRESAISGLYNFYCKLYFDRTYGEAPFDRLYEYKDQIADKFAQVVESFKSKKNEPLIEAAKKVHNPITSENTVITHGQILYSNNEGEILDRRIEKDGVPLAAQEFPMAFLAGSRDFVSSKHSIKRNAHHFNARYHEFDCYHHPFFESRDARHIILETLKHMTDNWQNLQLPENRIILFEHKNGAQVTSNEFEDPMINIK